MITSFDIPNQALFRYPNLYKLHPSVATQSKSLAEYFKKVKSNYNIVLLTNSEDKKSVSYGNIFASAFNDTTISIDSSIIYDSITPLRLKRGDNFYSVKKHLSRKDTNLIVICANDIPFMTYAFNKVIELSNSKDFFKYNFTIGGFEDLFNMSTIDNIYKNKFKIYFVSKGLIENNSKRVLKFKDWYQADFKMQVDQTSIIAYDLTMSIFNAVYPSKDNSVIYEGLFNNFNYEKIGPSSGFENKSVKLFRYNKYKLFQISEN
jgi:ABC-type branched-subunit amino acid transport system substrate-binding protein